MLLTRYLYLYCNSTLLLITVNLLCKSTLLLITEDLGQTSKTEQDELLARTCPERAPSWAGGAGGRWAAGGGLTSPRRGGMVSSMYPWGMYC